MSKFEKRIDRYISREWQIILGVVGILYAFYVMVLCPIQEQTAELAEIRNNHLVHIQSDISEIRKKQSDRDISDERMRTDIAKILVILEKDNK